MDITAKHAAPDKDGVRIAELDEESFRYLLWDHKPLTDFWMTGPGTVKRLEKHGIHTMGELAYFSTVNQDILYKILHASRPEPPHDHPRMPMSNRAKIFSPFAALRGYEDEIASEGRDHLKGNRIELSEEGKEVLNQKISQLRKGQEITIKYFTDGYYEDIAEVLDAVDAINKELRIYTGFINDTGKELPTIIAFEDISEIGVNMT